MDSSTVRYLVHKISRAHSRTSLCAAYRSSCAAGLLLLGLPLCILGSSQFSYPASAQSAISGSSQSKVEHETLLQEAEKLGTEATKLHKQGRYAEAVALTQKALSLQESLLGKEHPDVAISLNDLAGLYTRQGRYREAEPLYKRALFIQENEPEPKRLNAAAFLNNLASLYANQGRYREAEPLYKRALAIAEKSVGEQSNTAAYLKNLALLYTKQGRSREAEPLYKRALLMREKILERPNTVGSHNKPL